MIAERLEKLMQSENLNAAKMADLIDVQPSAISHILSGRNKPSFDFIDRIASKFPRLSIEWLITGKGNMYKTLVQRSIFDDSSEAITPHHENIPVQNNLDDKNKITNVIKKNSAFVTKIVVFYSDNTFDIYVPK